MADENYYGDDAPPQTAAPKGQDQTKDQGEEYPTVLVPKSICKDDMEVGDVFPVEVVQKLEDQFAIKYHTEGEGEEEEPTKETAPTPSPTGGGVNEMYS